MVLSFLKMSGQPVAFMVDNVEVCPGSTVAVPVQTENFNPVSGFQYSIAWDTAYLAFLALDIVQSEINSMIVNDNFVEAGRIGMLWNAEIPNAGLILEDSVTLFTLHFQTVDTATTTIEFGADPTLIEVVKFDNQTLTIVSPDLVPGTVYIAPLAVASTVMAASGSVPNGSIDLSVHNGTPPFQYEWSNGTTVQNPSNLSPGDYSVTITDADDCQGIFSFTVELQTSTTLPDSISRPIVFPTIVSDKLYISTNHLNHTIVEKWHLKIIGLDGRIWMEQDHRLNHRIEVDVNGLPGGWYFLKMDNGGESVVERFFK